MPTTPSALIFTEEVEQTTVGDQAPTPPTGSLTLFSNQNGNWYQKTSAAVVAALAKTIGAVLKPKDIEGTVYVDTANSQGWAGSDAGAWINSAFAYLIATYGTTFAGPPSGFTGAGVIQLGPGVFTYTTPIVLADQWFSIRLRGSGDGVANTPSGSAGKGGTVLNYTPTSGIALNMAGASSNNGGVALEDIALFGGTVGVVAAVPGGTAIGVQWGLTGGSPPPGSSTAGAAARNVSIVGFATGENWNNSGSIAYAVSHYNVKVQYCATGVTPYGEANLWFGGLFGNNTTGVGASNTGTDASFFGVAFDDQTSAAINVSSSSFRCTFTGCRFENAGLGTSVYIIQSAGSVSVQGGTMQEDNISGGPATGFITGTGGVCTVSGTWLYSGGRVVTQAFNVASPTQFSYSNILISPATSSPSTTLALLVPAQYLGTITANTSALTAADTLIKSIPIPLNTVTNGMTYRIRFHGSYAATVSNAVSFRARLGTTSGGGIADAQLCVVTTAAAGTTTTGFTGEIMVTIRSLGATAAVMANGYCFGLAAAVTNPSNQTATVAVNTTVTNWLSLTAGPAATTSNLTFTNCTIEPVQLNSAN
jgi:hypothetical protein